MSLTTRVRNTRSFSGCWTCRARKVKCDEKRPNCSRCIKRELKCEGYGLRLVWVDEKTKEYEGLSRRAVIDAVCLPAYEDADVESMIISCDTAVYTSIFGPFGVHHLDDWNDNYLFAHYLKTISNYMQPCGGENPWVTVYPSLALQDDSRVLMSAMLAQAAFHVANCKDDEEWRNRGKKFYGKAITGLRTKLEGNLALTPLERKWCLATMLTLTMVDVYSGLYGSGRMHLKGAYGLLESMSEETAAESAVFVQSLRVMDVIGGEAATIPDDDDVLVNNMAAPLDELLDQSSVPYGITVGATRQMLKEISTMKELYLHKVLQVEHQPQDPRRRSSINDSDVLTERLHQLQLNRLGPQTEDPVISSYTGEKISFHHHLMVFEAAIKIYRTMLLLEQPPNTVARTIDEGWHHVQAYHASGGTSISIWPVVVLSFESYEEQHRKIAANCWTNLVKAGMGNRTHIKKLVEEVWRRRAVAAEETGMDPGQVKVNWQKVMKEMEIDVLLV